VIAVTVRVVGAVQGVGFRWFTAREADRLGVSGWIRNRADGTVEAHLEGTESAVDTLIAWLDDGPSAAVVDEVEVIVATVTGVGGFTIRR
jgi:acylphosphatase